MNKTFVKGLVMTVVAFLANLVYSKGLPVGVIAWEVTGLTMLGSVLTYLGNTVLIPTTSGLFSVANGDYVKGVLLALGSGLSAWGANALLDQPIDWNGILSLVVTMVSGYFVKTLGTNSVPK